MNKKILGVRVGTIIAAVLCLAAAFATWLCISVVLI